MTLSFRILLIVASLALPLAAQSVISARSGLIHYIEGDVFAADQKVVVSATSFPELKDGQVLRTGEGRAEVLLNPGAFLRIGENSSVRMVTARLTDTRLEFLSGSVIIECDDLLKEKDNLLTVVYQDVTVQLEKSGIYRFDSSPAQLRVYEGQADVKTASNVLTVKEGRLLSFAGAVTTEKFDAGVGDALSRWSKRRAENLAVANLSAAKQVRDSEGSWSRGGWYYNPYFGMFSYIPMSGVWRSPYGFLFYSPRQVYRVYERPMMTSPAAYGVGAPSWNAGYGYNTMRPTMSGHSGTIAASSGNAGVSAPVTTGSGAAAAPISRGDSNGGGRSR